MAFSVGIHALRRNTGAAAPAASAAEPCQSGSPGSAKRVPKLPRPLALALFAFHALLMTVVLHLYFARIRVRGAVPHRGATLLVANHPCTWVDAGLIDLVLRRRVHFLTDRALFLPWLRGLFLGIYGALPVAGSHTPRNAEGAHALNAATFARCARAFTRGEAVALFPEGVSLTDRTLLPLHRGAARLALGTLARDREHTQALRLVPVSLHYSDRLAFRSEVTVTLGDAVPWRDLLPAHEDADEHAIEHLTARFAARLREAIVDHDAGGAEAARTLEPFAAPAQRAPTLEQAQTLVHALTRAARRAPTLHAELSARAERYARLRRALRVHDAALGPAPRVHHVLAALLGAPIAFAGALVHAVPLALIVLTSRGRDVAPSHVPLRRITAAMVWLPPCYALLALALALATRDAGFTLAGLATAALFGAVLCTWMPAAAVAHERLRLAAIARTHARALARARALHTRLTLDVAALLEPVPR